MTKTVDACPRCDFCRIRARNPEKIRSHAEGEGRYRCVQCGHTFDEPHTRPARNESGPHRGLAARLADPDVSDVSDLERGEA